MGGAPVSVKYLISAKFEVDGIVEKPDIIGAIFGQTEGLLGDELELRELQKAGKVGRIEVTLSVKNGKTYGEIKIPTSLNKFETALIAAAVETIDKVGPSNAKIRVSKIVDVRAEKRKRIIARARELLMKWKEEVETKQLINELLESLKAGEIIQYGPEKLPAGPDVEKSEELIIVEGRADVLNLLKHGYTNVIAIGGARIPKSVIELSKKKKKVIVFLDGDRGGDLILKALLNNVKIDYVARAPAGREVEELSGKEIAKALSNKVPVEKILSQLKLPPVKKVKEEVLKEKAAEVEKPPVSVEVPKEIIESVKEVSGTMEGIVLGEGWKVIGRYKLSNLYQELEKIDEPVLAVVMDGVVTPRIFELAYSKGAKWVVGYLISEHLVRKPTNVNLLRFSDLPIEEGKDEG